MQGSIAAQAFSFDQQFKPYQKDEFVMVVLSSLYLKHFLFSCFEIIPVGSRRDGKCSSDVTAPCLLTFPLKAGDGGGAHSLVLWPNCAVLRIFQSVLMLLCFKAEQFSHSSLGMAI